MSGMVHRDERIEEWSAQCESTAESNRASHIVLGSVLALLLRISSGLAARHMKVQKLARHAGDNCLPVHEWQRVLDAWRAQQHLSPRM